MSQRMMVPGIDKAKLIHSPITKLNKSNGRNSEHIYKTESLPDISRNLSSGNESWKIVMAIIKD